MAGAQPDVPLPDPAAALTHLQRLFARPRIEYPNGMVEIAWMNARGGITQANLFPLTDAGFDGAVALAMEQNRRGFNAYVGVNPRKPGTMPAGRCDALDVEISFFHFADVDTIEGVKRLQEAMTLPYTFAVTTGRTPNTRPHVYWELDEPTRNMEAWSAQQAGIASHFHGDRVIDSPRIMRLAGTINYPSMKKASEGGYIVEPVTIRTQYADERSPVSPMQMAQAYTPGPLVPPPVQPLPSARAEAAIAAGADPDTGEFPTTNVVHLFKPEGIDPVACLSAIDAGRELHNNARDIAAHMVGIGYPDWPIRELLARALRPVSDGGTFGEISKLISTARQRYGKPDDGEFEANPSKPSEPLLLTPVGILDPSKRAPRQWLVPFRMMRRHLTMTTAAPGVGKSTLAIEEAVSMASGIDFLGFGITKPLRVAIINNEETRDELERRIEATCLHFNIPPESIADNLFLYSGVDAAKLIVARANKNGNIIPDVNVENLRALVDKLKLDCVIIDPFVQTHFVEESDNGQISQVMVLLRSIGAPNHGSTHTAAIHLIHHNRKPVAGSAHQAGDINASRGASSMGGEAHFFFTLADMGDEGEDLGVGKDDRGFFLRLDDAKRKMSPATKARWFERIGVDMPYGIKGEEVGVLAPKEFVAADTALTASKATEILTIIQTAWNLGEPYSKAPRSQDRYVVRMMMRDFAMTRTVAKGIVDDWAKNSMIAETVISAHSKMKGVQVLRFPG